MIYYLFKTINITLRDIAVKGLSRTERICIGKAIQKISNKFKKRRQALRLKRKTFNKAVSEVNFTNKPEDSALVYR